MSERALNITSILSQTPLDLACTRSDRPIRLILRRLFDLLEARHIRYCHWKSNIRLAEALGGDDDVDLLIDRCDASEFYRILFDTGFKLAKSRGGIGHPGVVHALAIDENRIELVHLHIYSRSYQAIVWSRTIGFQSRTRFCIIPVCCTVFGVRGQKRNL